MDHVLVALDDSPQAMAALEYALSEFPLSRVSLLTVIDPTDTGIRTDAMLPQASEDWYESRVEAAESRFEEAAALAEEHAVEVADTVMEVGRPSRLIIEYAETNGIDHLVMGSHGRSGVTRILLGSVAETVVRRSPVPVTVVR